jgi:hypothetical protein
MSAQTYPAQGLSRLVIDEMAGDGQIIGVADAEEIQISGPGMNGASLFSAAGDIVHFTGHMAERVVVPAHLSVAVRAASGDLRVQDTQAEVSVEAVHGDLRLRNLGGPVHLGEVNGDLRADGVSALQMGACNGDMRMQDGTSLEIERVDGDLRVVSMDSARVSRVGGDFAAEQVRTTLDVGEVNGDVRLTEIGGLAHVQVAHGDLRAENLTGGLAVPMVHGDAELQGRLGSEQEYALAAHGDVHLHLPTDADVRLTVRANGRIRSDVQLTPAPDGTPNFTAVVGHGTGRLTVQSGGDLRIKLAGATGTTETREGRGANTENWSDLGERIRQQVSASLAAAGINVETGEVNFNWKHGGRGARKWGFEAPQPPAHPASPARPVPPARPASPARPGEAADSGTRTTRPSAEEQLAILRMVENGTITAQEAETLLRALGA